MTSLKEKAYDVIKQKIIYGVYKQGEALNEAQLIKELGIGRTPIREAFLNLASEKFVHILPRRGIVVTSINAEDIARLLELRKVLEVYYAKKLLKRGDLTEVDHLKRIIKEREKGSKDSDAQKVFEADMQFHLGVLKVLGDPFLIEILQKIYDRLARIWFFADRRRPKVPLITQDHEKILAAIKSGDAELLASKIAEHIDHAKENLLSVLMEE